MQYRLSLAIACFFMLLGTVSAQNHAFTGSVTTTETAEPQLDEEERQSQQWDQRQARAEGFRADSLATQRGMQLFAEYQAAYARNRKEHADDCHQSIRRSNKHGRFAVTARCYRTALLMEREFWQKHLQQAESMPGITEEMRTNVLEEITAIIDAIDTIIQGIDNDVYSDTQGLLEAKHNLHAKYRAPASLALSKMRADRTLTWIAHFMSRMLYLLETERISEATFQEMEEALYCLEVGELFMQEILLENDYKKANLLLSQSLQHLFNCSPHLQKAYELHQTP